MTSYLTKTISNLTIDFFLMLCYNKAMKCKFCKFENITPSKAGKDRNGIQRYYCQGCHRQIQDQNDYQEWANSRRKRAPNQPSNKNEFDEYVTYAICKALTMLALKNLYGIGSSYSIAALLERPASTIQFWLHKYKSIEHKPNKRMTKRQLQEYANSKKFGSAIVEFFATVELEYKKLHK